MSAGRVSRLEVCRRYNVDLKKMEPVRQHAAQLFR